MKKILVLFFVALFLSAPRLSAQIGFDFGMNYEFLSSKAPEGYKATGFGMGPYIGIIYGIPVTMSSAVNIGLNYKYDILWGAPGAWRDEKKLDPFTLLNVDTDIKEHHLQIPVTYFRSVGIFSLSAGPVFDYCLASTISNLPGGGKADTIKDLGMKPFNIYLKAGAGIGMKIFSFNLTASYGILDLMPDKQGLHRLTVGMDMHLNF